MLEILCRFLPGTLLCAIAGWLCWAYCTNRTLKRDRNDLASFFYPADLVSTASLGVLRLSFAAGIAGVLFAGFVATNGDDATLTGLNTYLLSSLVQVAPPAVNKVLIPIKDHVLQGDFGAASKAIHSLTLTILVGLAAMVFTPHLVVFYRLARGKFQRFIDDFALLQARAAAHRLADGNPAEALQRLLDAHPQLAIPAELNGADPESRLTYALLALAARNTRKAGITGALAALLEDAPALARQASLYRRMHRIGAAAFLYVAGCVLYIAVVPTWSTKAPDGAKFIVKTSWFHYTCDWIDCSAEALRDLGLQIAQFSLVVIVPFVVGLCFYTNRRRRLPAETREEAMREVLSGLFVLPLAASGFFIGLEALRFHYQQERDVPTDLFISMLRNVVQDVLMSCIPLLLVWVWTSLRAIKFSLLLACIAGSIVAGLCCTIIQLIFEAMLTAENSEIQLALAAHSALLGFYLVCLVGLSALLFLPDVLRSDPGPTAV